MVGTRDKGSHFQRYNVWHEVHNLWLPLHFSFFLLQPPGAEGDIFAAEERKKKTKPKGTEKKKSKKPKGRTDEDLFGNTDDIFGDLPAAAKTKSPKTKKKKKKVEQSTTAATAAPEGAAEESKSLSC